MDGNNIIRVQTLDCSTTIIKKSNMLRFDEQLKFFHCYGEEMALQANWAGLGAFVINVPIKHNTNWTAGPGFKRSRQHVIRKWRTRFGRIYTTVGDF